MTHLATNEALSKYSNLEAIFGENAQVKNNFRAKNISQLLFFRPFHFQPSMQDKFVSEFVARQLKVREAYENVLPYPINEATEMARKSQDISLKFATVTISIMIAIVGALCGALATYAFSDISDLKRDGKASIVAIENVRVELANTKTELVREIGGVREQAVGTNARLDQVIKELQKSK